MFKRGTLAATIGLTKPNMNDYTKFHPNLHKSIPKLAMSSSLIIFRNNFGYYIHENHGIIAKYSILPLIESQITGAEPFFKIK